MSLRTVLDTNVLVSGLSSDHSPPRQLVDAWLDGQYNLVTSLHQVEELNHVLVYPHIASRLGLSDAEVDLILAALLSQGQVVPGTLQSQGVARDPRDDPLAACAVEGAADYLVSGDSALLNLGETGNTRTVTPREFVEILGLRRCRMAVCRPALIILRGALPIARFVARLLSEIEPYHVLRRRDSGLRHQRRSGRHPATPEP